MPAISQVDFEAVQAAVERYASRVSALLRSVRHPDAKAIGQWDLTDVAAHVSHAFDVVTAVAQGGGSILDDVWHLSSMTKLMVRGESERDLGALADRLDQSAKRFLATMEAARGDEPRGWLVEGVELPMSALAGHVLNELMVHGADIAAADGVPWPIEAADAVLVVNGFLFPVVGGLGRAMVDQEAAAGVDAAIDVRVRGGSPATFRFHDGDLVLDTSGPGKGASGRVDCHVSVDPVAFLMVAWGRQSQWPAILRGQMLAWGRKPWVALKLRALMRNP